MYVCVISVKVQLEESRLCNGSIGYFRSTVCVAGQLEDI